MNDYKNRIHMRFAIRKRIIFCILFQTIMSWAKINMMLREDLTVPADYPDAQAWTIPSLLLAA